LDEGWWWTDFDPPPGDTLSWTALAPALLSGLLHQDLSGVSGLFGGMKNPGLVESPEQTWLVTANRFLWLSGLLAIQSLSSSVLERYKQV
jgi:hypothetical protein